MDWLEILTESTQRIKAVVTPLIKTSIAQESYGKGAGGDLMKHIDLEAERALVETLTEHNLNFTLVSEESGVKRFGSKPSYFVTTDPVDGTTNALKGIPFACTSIAISKLPRLSAVESAAVADLFHDSTYLAQRKLGAYCNYRKITPTQTTKLTEAVIGLDLNSYGVAELSSKLNRLLAQTKHVRHLGANALELCYVADGTIDAFVDIREKLRITDVAAATLIVKEAGASVTSPRGSPLTNALDPTERVAFVAAGNPRLHRTIIENLEKA